MKTSHILTLLVAASGCPAATTPPCAGSSCGAGADLRCSPSNNAIERCRVTAAQCLDWSLDTSCSGGDLCAPTGDAAVVACQPPTDCQATDPRRCGADGGIETCVHGRWTITTQCEHACDPGGDHCLPKATCTELGSALGPAIAAGTTGGASNDLASCAQWDGGQGPDVCFTWTAPADGIYRFGTEASSFTTELKLTTYPPPNGFSTYEVCPSGPLPNRSIVYRRLTSGERLYIAIDGPTAQDQGPYVLGIEVDAACSGGRCYRDTWESCDSTTGLMDPLQWCPNGCSSTSPLTCN